ncbi:5-(carboxyamino)imidazole ribonucleotide synthase [Thermotoga sp. KOL6]|uniref:5-(carboxyamino)imidazole ribonucleotide synthase n=1 Tax=Thermotoga sp. KOL6 TaxID=126741 RepID=UPI000C7563B6|nr:5-(carboxyamino)imidazole ribonucleotide synthase [Thermotoga sp. KOL6]PLV59176.1 phosphoribosylaminoimidazole carboxylase [Thermotoga sp. KOL6]
MKKIGIIGGGQLGKMMSLEAKKMGFYVTILDPTPKSPAGQVADEQITANFFDSEKIEKLVRNVDVTTYDLEHIDIKTLKRLYNEGYEIHPSPYILEIIQDKFAQKEFLRSKGIPVPRYKLVTNLEKDVEEFSFPVVQKARKGGYDGRGVFVIKNKADIEEALVGETYLEEFVPIEKEIAVMVARNKKGEVKCYPVVEMFFDEEANICDTVIAPARIEKKFEKRTKEIATSIVEAFEGIGVFGIEMFLTKNGEILVNEIAPRPHNSGHYTIEACVTSQFEQHIRAIMNLPLGSTKLLTPAVMVNLLGEKDYHGTPKLIGLENALEIEGLSLHFYGKKETRPFRKMGHFTVVDDNVETALEKALRAKKILKVVSEEVSSCRK